VKGLNNKMANYKINRNKPVLSDEQINNHKDFSKVLNNHQKVLKYKDATKPLYKSKGFMGLIVLICVVLLVFVITDREENSNNVEKKDSMVTPKKETPINNDSIHHNYEDTITIVKPAHNYSSNVLSSFGLKTFNIPFTTYKIDAVKGAAIYSGSTRILIPPSAFINQSGEKITGEIEINYREFKDPFDMFFASIPMHDTATQQQLVSVGMFEIKGFQNGKEIIIKEPIMVELVTPQHSNYNFYYLNQSIDKWEFVSKEKKSLRFAFEANEKDFPEMQPFKDLLWEIPITSTQKNPEEFNYIFSKTWSKFLLSDKMKGVTPADAKLKKNSSEPKFLVLPVAITSNKTINDKIIEAKYKQYYEEMKKKEKDQKTLTEAFARQAEWLKSAEGETYINWIKSNEGQKTILSSRIVSMFSVNKFGIWNCSTPERLPQGAIVKANIVDATGKKLILNQIYLVDYSKNTLYTYYPNESIQFNPKSENLLWAPLTNGSLAFFSKAKFKSIPTKGDVIIPMEIINVNSKSEEEVKKILGIKYHKLEQLTEKEKNPTNVYARKVVMKTESRARDVFYQKDGVEINSSGNKQQ